MGKFSEAVSKGRKQEIGKEEKKKAADDASVAAQTVAIEGGHKWIEEVVRPVVDEANSDLKNEKLSIVWEPGKTTHPSVTLSISKTDMPSGHPTGRSIGFTVFDGGHIKVYPDGGRGTDLGTIANVKSDKIEKLLTNLLQEIGGQLARGR